MLRKAAILKSSADYGSPYNRHICVDIESGKDIFECIKKKKTKFWYTVERTLIQANLYWDGYGKEEVNSKTKNTSAIKFFDLDNTRIYCKELSGLKGELYIVCADILMQKKVQKNNNAIIAILEKISNYDYQIIE